MTSQVKLYASVSPDDLPQHPNPVAEFRADQGLTQADLGGLSGVTRLTVLRAEQGVFPNITPSLLYGMLNRAVIVTSVGQVLASVEEFQDAYHAFQFDQRRLHYGHLTETLPPYISGTSPLTQWRISSGLSQIGLCVAFCVHPVGVAQIEKRLQKQLPAQLVTSLLDSGYDKDILEELQVRQVHYFNGTAKGVKTSGV